MVHSLWGLIVLFCVLLLGAFFCSNLSKVNWVQTYFFLSGVDSLGHGSLLLLVRIRAPAKLNIDTCQRSQFLREWERAISFREATENADSRAYSETETRSSKLRVT